MVSKNKNINNEKEIFKMKDLRLILSIFLLILVVFLLTGCGGVVPPSPGATEEDVTTISGQILMPAICCLPLPEEEAMSKDNGCNETEFWAEIPNARVELKSAEKCNNVLDETFTDASGYYEFEDVKPGLYIITAYCTEDDGFVVKDVAVKEEGQALNAGIPDCTSTGIALVLEEINDCYNDFYQCFGKYTTIYDKVKSIAEAIGEVNIQNILNQYQAIESIDTLAAAAGITDVQPILDDFGDVCNPDLYGLVDMICEWNCCLAPGATGGGGGGNGDEDVTYELIMQVSPEGGGTTTPSVGGSPHTYDEGTVVNISATAAEGYDFVNWTGDVADSNLSSTTVTMDADKTVTANFVDPCADNSAPYVIELNNKSAVVGQLYTGTVIADDNDDDTLTFAFADEYTPPGDMAIDSETGVITWTPTEEDICFCEQIASSTVRQKSELIEVRICDLIQVTVSDPCESVDAEFCVSVQPAPNPDLEVVKTATESSFSEVDNIIHYTITVENTGNVTISNLNVTDPQATTGPTYDSGDASNDGILGVGETWTYLATHSITQADLDASSFTNTATATGKDPQNQDVTDSDDETVDAAISYTLILNVNPSGGGTVSGDGTFVAGTVAPISTTANDGYQFTGWSVDLGNSSNVGNTGLSSTNVTMNEDMTLTANFVTDIYQGGTLSVAFEDLEIALDSDYDYNDWVVDLEMDTVYDGDTPNLSSITFDITPKARGAGNDHRFHILIPADTFSENGNFVLDISGAGGDDTNTFDASANMDFVVIPDTRDSLGNESGNTTNTVESSSVSPTVIATLTITFDTPFYYDFSQYDPYSASNMHGEGLFFDPYIEVDEAESDREFDIPNYEIHKSDPRILTVPDTWQWPEEGIAIWNVYVSSVSEGNPPVFSPAWWEVSPNNCVYGDEVTCP
jgi:LruC domain-containing protein/uncharacterized repeat protein (TIGR02543 family)